LTSFIIDAEIAAIDPITSALRTFQELSYRSKKDVDMADVKIRVGVFAFDLMFLNGEVSATHSCGICVLTRTMQSLLAEPFRARRERLRSIFSSLAPLDPRCAKWELVPSTEDTNPQAVQAFFAQALEVSASSPISFAH
jgi:DNA ligase-1